MAKKVVTLYIDDTAIRLLVTAGKRIKKWADLPLEPGLVKGAVVIKEAEVAAKTKQLVKALKVKTKKVVVGLSGLHSLTRPITLPQLPKAMLDEAVIREAKRVLPVPLDQFYISWQTIATTDSGIHVFVVAIPRKTADTLLKMLYKAGLAPQIMDLKPLALTKMVTEPTAVIVDVQPTEFDIVIMADGVPQPIRTVPLPSEAQSWEEKLPMIRADLDRTIKFYNSNNPEKPLVSDVPIYVSGELANEPEMCQSLSDELGQSVLPLSSPLRCPEQLDPSRYMFNISLAFKELSSGKKAGPSVVNLNALPTAYRPKPISLTRIFALPSAVIVVSLLTFLIILVQSASANIASMHSQLDITNQLLKQKQLQRQELMENIAELEKKLAEAQASYNTFITALDSLDKQRNGVKGELEAVTNNLPSTVSMTNISHAGSRLTLKGRASGEAEVLSYAKNLDASGRFPEIVIASMMRVEGEGMDFTLILKTRGRD